MKLLQEFFQANGYPEDLVKKTLFGQPNMLMEPPLPDVEPPKDCFVYLPYVSFHIFALAAVITVQSRVAQLPFCLMTINVINVAFIQGQLLLCFTLLSVASTKWVRRLFEQIIT